METIFHLVEINAPKETIYSAITTEEGLSKWWLPETIAKAEIGFINEFRYRENGVNKMKITELTENKWVKWICVDSDKEWIGTNVTFQIEERAENCRLHFKHSGWRKQTDFFANCNYHWARHLRILKEYCETGSSQLKDGYLKEI